MIRKQDYPTSIRLPAKLRKALLQEADDERRHLAVHIRYILEQWITIRQGKRGERKQ